MAIHNMDHIIGRFPIIGGMGPVAMFVHNMLDTSIDEHSMALCRQTTTQPQVTCHIRWLYLAVEGM
jgi:hypothetical protein